MARDDRSLAYALMTRAVVEGRCCLEGKGGSLEYCAELYERAFRVLIPDMRRTRDSIIIGTGAAATLFWFSRRSSRYADPRVIIGRLMALRSQMRKEGIPVRSIVDARARWVLGLAMWRFSGGRLSIGAEYHLFGGRDDLSVVGHPRDVVELSLDIQWCLVDEGRWARARVEWEIVEDLAIHLSQRWQIAVVMWKEALVKEVIDANLIERCFYGLRGLSGIAVPGIKEADDHSPLGW